MVRRTATRLRVVSRVVIVMTILGLVSTGAMVALANHPASSGFSIDGTVADAGAIEFADDFGNVKELGPINSNTTKLGVIHDDALPTLDTSNPNGQVDLRRVWFDTNTAGGTDWLYFAWERDSTNGSGVIAIEFQQDAAPAACDYAGSTTAELIAGCNPWANRQEGDFILIWDQVGGTIQISVRTFDGTVFGPPDPLDAHEAAATLNADTSRGEAVVDLGVIFGEDPTECISIANVIPGTITGNSDTADYKDTVLADIAGAISISNCGSLKLKKTDDAGTALQGAVFTLYESDGDADFEPGADDPIAQDPDGNNQTCTTDASGNCTISEIFFGEYWIDETTVPSNHDKPSTLPQKVTISGTTTVDLGTFVNPRQTGSILVEKILAGTTTRVGGASFAIDDDGDQETGDDQTTIPGVSTGLFCIDGLQFGDYTVVETAPPSGYTAAAGAQTHTVDSASDCATRVEDEDEPDLTFENQKVTSLVTSANESVVIGNDIHDTATLSGGVNPTGTISFAVYDNDTCTGTALFTTSLTVNGNGSYGPVSFTPTEVGTYYWLASYSGDASNTAATHLCGASGEVDTVGTASPGLSTSPNLLPNDSATLTGGFGTLGGSLTFELFANGVCDSSEDPIYEETVTVNGTGTYETSNETVFITADGTYSWLVSYSGDASNDGAVSTCDAEQMVIDFTPLSGIS